MLNTRTLAITLSTTAALALSACATAPKQPATPDIAGTWQCGKQTLVIAKAADAHRLTAGGRTYDLRQEPVASGAWFEAKDDASTWFWAQPGENTASLKGLGLPACVRK
jgi:hypothetical protein